MWGGLDTLVDKPLIKRAEFISVSTKATPKRHILLFTCTTEVDWIRVSPDGAVDVSSAIQWGGVVESAAACLLLGAPASAFPASLWLNKGNKGCSIESLHCGLVVVWVFNLQDERFWVRNPLVSSPACRHP